MHAVHYSLESGAIVVGRAEPRVVKKSFLSSGTKENMIVTAFQNSEDGVIVMMMRLFQACHRARGEKKQTPSFIFVNSRG